MTCSSMNQESLGHKIVKLHILMWLGKDKIANSKDFCSAKKIHKEINVASKITRRDTDSLQVVMKYLQKQQEKESTSEIQDHDTAW